jgi:hypothetical protein
MKKIMGILIVGIGLSFAGTRAVAQSVAAQDKRMPVRSSDPAPVVHVAAGAVVRPPVKTGGGAGVAAGGAAGGSKFVPAARPGGSAAGGAAAGAAALPPIKKAGAKMN